MGFSGPAYACKYTMEGFGFKIDRLHAMVVSFTARCRPANILALTKWDGCVGAIHITVKLKLLQHEVVFLYWWSLTQVVLIQCVRKT